MKSKNNTDKISSNLIIVNLMAELHDMLGYLGIESFEERIFFNGSDGHYWSISQNLSRFQNWIVYNSKTHKLMHRGSDVGQLLNSRSAVLKEIECEADKLHAINILRPLLINRCRKLAKERAIHKIVNDELSISGLYFCKYDSIY